MGKSVAQFDRRLIGKWRSDRRRTFRFFKPHSNSTPRQHRKLKALFGKLVIRWGRGNVYTEMEGRHDSAKYRIVASDAESIVVRTRNVLTGQSVLQQIHFDGDYYWVGTIGGSLNEWFRRLR